MSVQGPIRTFRNVRYPVAIEDKADLCNPALNPSLRPPFRVMSPDDMVASVKNPKIKRARGYFTGTLGRSRICV